MESVQLSTEQMMAVLKTFGVAGADVGQGRDVPALVRLRLAQAILGAAEAHALPRAEVLCPCRACGSTVEITRSLATRRAIRNTPAASASRS
ncbi:hypothetical protein [Micromonospora fulviviridis]|uniref:Transposase n=1 Tax=Micromonospora fulviviridis TaxID=47860 RepID=A0ABV2VYP2_9ACTN